MHNIYFKRTPLSLQIQFILQNNSFARAHTVEPQYNEPLHDEVLGITRFQYT